LIKKEYEQILCKIEVKHEGFNILVNKTKEASSRVRQGKYRHEWVQKKINILSKREIVERSGTVQCSAFVKNLVERVAEPLPKGLD